MNPYFMIFNFLSTQYQSMSEDHTHGSGDELKIRTLNRQQ